MLVEVFIDSSSPLASMRSSVKMNYFAVYEGSRFQEKYQVHDFRNVGQSIERTQLFQELMRLYLVHWCVHNSRRNGIETYSISRKLDRQCARDRLQTTFRQIDQTARESCDGLAHY
jgi:hypothetical protein